MERDRISILTLQNSAMNETVQKCKDETKSQIQDLRIETLEYQLQTLRFRVKHHHSIIFTFLPVRLFLRLQIDVFNTTMENWNLAFSISPASESKPGSKKSGSVEQIERMQKPEPVATWKENDSSEEFLSVDCVLNC